jgi:hypothetical protein
MGMVEILGYFWVFRGDLMLYILEILRVYLILKEVF